MPLSLLLLAPALAADRVVDPFEEHDESDLFRAEQRVVPVASRYAQTVWQGPSIVAVVTDDDLRSRGYRTLSDVLRSIPGVYISVARESRDLAWFCGVISSNDNEFLVLFDGVPWYDGVYAHAWIDEYLPMVSVKQVEVVKGSGPAIYGINAFAGVVDIVTSGGRDLQGGFACGEADRWAHRDAAAVYADGVGSGGSEAEVEAFARYMDGNGDGPTEAPRLRRDVNDLEPKRDVAAGLGLRIDALSLKLDAVEYRHTCFVSEQDDVIDDIANEIDAVDTPDPQLGDCHYVNRGGSTTNGGEIGATSELDDWTIDASDALTQAIDRDTGFLQYEFPPHMAHGRLGHLPLPRVTFSRSADIHGPRPQTDWTPDSRLQDSNAVALLHADVSMHNMLDTGYETLVYVEDANLVDADGSATYPNDIEGEGRTAVVGVEHDF